MAKQTNQGCPYQHGAFYSIALLRSHCNLIHDHTYTISMDIDSLHAEDIGSLRIRLSLTSPLRLSTCQKARMCSDTPDGAKTNLWPRTIVFYSVPCISTRPWAFLRCLSSSDSNCLAWLNELSNSPRKCVFAVYDYGEESMSTDTSWRFTNMVQKGSRRSPTTALAPLPRRSRGMGKTPILMLSYQDYFRRRLCEGDSARTVLEHLGLLGRLR